MSKFISLTRAVASSTRILVLVIVLALGSVSAQGQSPPGDFGDAPVGDNVDGIYAYPGVLARWVSWYQHRNTVTAPVQHLNGTWLHAGASFRLGDIPPTSTNDTQQQPSAPENDAAPVIVLEALGSNPLAQLHLRVSTDSGHPPDQPFYLNVFVDQDRTGEWKDGWQLGSPVVTWDLEWVAQDVSVLMPADEARTITLGYIRLESPTSPVWLRLIVSDAPIGAILKGGEPLWDATMTSVHSWSGEIEDHYLEYQTAYHPGVKGIYPWWVYGRGAGGGGGNPKPACDAFYHGPKTVTTPWCGDGFAFFNPIYRTSERNGGCAPDLLWGMYGYKHLAGVMVPPTVALNNPAFFTPGTGGLTALNCPDGTVLNLPAAVQGFPPTFTGHVSAATLRGGTAPPAFRACYGAPKRFRAYRAFLEVMSCGSVHQSMAVQTGPAHDHAPAAITAIGQRVDYVDFLAGDLEEAFLDPEFERPFPDPDFFDYAISLVEPTGQGGLDEDVFQSAPASLHLQGAVYTVRPQIPGERRPLRMAGIHLTYLTAPGTDTIGQITLTSMFGEVMTVDLPPAEDSWADLALALPSDFALQEITIELADGWIDDLVVPLLSGADCNANGMDDTIDLLSGISSDLDGNGIPDECDLVNPCAGYCGSQSPDGCWCDENCAEFGDCCEGVETACADPVSSAPGGNGVPSELAIADAAPNPFNPLTTIRFDLPRPDEVTVAVYDVRGGLVRELWTGSREAGRHLLQWNGRDDRGRSVPSGVYLVRIVTAAGAWRSMKVTLAR